MEMKQTAFLQLRSKHKKAVLSDSSLCFESLYFIITIRYFHQSSAPEIVFLCGTIENDEKAASRYFLCNTSAREFSLHSGSFSGPF